MQQQVKALKKKLPLKGAYPGIVKTNADLNKKQGTPLISLHQVKNFFSNRNVSNEVVEAIIISTKAYLETEAARKEATLKLLSA